MIELSIIQSAVIWRFDLTLVLAVSLEHYKIYIYITFAPDSVLKLQHWLAGFVGFTSPFKFNVDLAICYSILIGDQFHGILHGICVQIDTRL